VAKKLSRRKPEEAPPPVEEPATIEPLLYNTDDACLMLGKISKPMLYRLITQGKIHPIKLGSRSMFTKKELERYIKQCAEESHAV
jgi:excisionase family DNA binding protein